MKDVLVVNNLNVGFRQDGKVHPAVKGVSFTIGEGETVALVFNPDLRVARLRVGVAEATAEYAGLWDDPELSIDVLNITSSVPNPWVLGSALAFTIPVSGRLRVEKARADAAMYDDKRRRHDSD